ncbi:hypothetical protein Kopi_042 [Pseudomonas phage Kopi]|uniref:Uncharacterized protein n=1 Tax=Pseudomonas phage Kopi TaxID=2880993 RepID=A0AAE8Y3W4_9CAUD|nr:hypothetical protein PM397_gp42 [Pseudomonas phage Kopi]UDF60314.1 hypothetical protein Kopi_042 [Pseudomonas phage Kopi]
MIKEQRWYAVKGTTAYIFDEPFMEKSKSVSIINVRDLAYYRNNFKLSKCWE